MSPIAIADRGRLISLNQFLVIEARITKGLEGRRSAISTFAELLERCFPPADLISHSLKLVRQSLTFPRAEVHLCHVRLFGVTSACPMSNKRPLQPQCKALAVVAKPSSSGKHQSVPSDADPFLERLPVTMTLSVARWSAGTKGFEPPRLHGLSR
jgi:hypothetical protein